MSSSSSKVELAPLRALGFPPGTVSAADLERWLSESFSLSASVDASLPLSYSSESQSASTGLRYVLEQRLGGPCGVLAAVQAHMIGHLLFECELDMDLVTREQAEEALMASLVAILARMATEEVVLCSGNVAEDSVTAHRFASAAAASAWLSEAANGDAYREPGGIMLFMYAAMLTRSVDAIREDMDNDSTQGLTGQFGHCTQELLNLVLCGVAASQVHDGVVDLGGGMQLRGVPSRPTIGYLTHMEALRYCAVGSFYKKPELPVWVVGSDSHYTVLYGTDRTINHESLRQAALARAKRAFKELDQQENGFVQVESVPDVLRKLDLELTAEQIAEFLAATEMAGSGIVLWSIFWTTVKPMLVPRLDWNCSKCTFFNAKEATTCEVCTEQRTDDVAVDEGQDEDSDDPRTFDLVHVNGLISRKQGQLQGPKVAKFKLTIVSRDLQAPSTHGMGEPMEETLHTRWPGALFLWPNDRAPSISG